MPLSFTGVMKTLLAYQFKENICLALLSSLLTQCQMLCYELKRSDEWSAEDFSRPLMGAQERGKPRVITRDYTLVHRLYTPPEFW